MDRAPHRIYGIVPAAKAYSAGAWLEDAARAIEEAKQEGRIPILVGGTGLYFKGLLEGLAQVPEVPPETRKAWRDQAEEIGAEGLYRELSARDPAMAVKIRPSDTQRIVRALEVIDGTGVSLLEWQGGNTAPVLDSEETLKLVIAPERDALYAAIDTRFDAMIAQGAIEEVQALLALHLDPGLPAMRAHGVRELAAYLAGTSSLEEAIAKAKTESRRYAKRQMTWLRRFMQDWDWVPDAPAAIASIDMSFPRKRKSSSPRS
jgi:tRNA dimethylallyltransferase